MTDPIPARVAALKIMPMPELKAEWRTLFDSEPPPFNRRHLENRIAYRIQELAYGGLKPETIRRLEILGEQYDSENVTTRRIRHDARPVAGTRLVREYRGVEHTVTVLADGYEWEGRPYRSLSAIARAITGTRWNGLVFWGLRHSGCRYATMPGTRADFWQSKFQQNTARDARAVAELGEGGWRVAVIWECALRGDRAAKATNELCEWLLGSRPRFETEPTTRCG